MNNDKLPPYSRAEYLEGHYMAMKDYEQEGLKPGKDIPYPKMSSGYQGYRAASHHLILLEEQSARFP